MRLYIHSNTDLEDVRYSFTVPRTNRKYRFSGKVDSVRGFMWGDIQRIAPYDDADYYWAKITGNGQVQFIHNGKVEDKMQMWSYEEDDYEDINDYFNDIIEEAAKELDHFNDSIKPRMMYN